MTVALMVLTNVSVMAIPNLVSAIDLADDEVDEDAFVFFLESVLGIS